MQKIIHCILALLEVLELIVFLQIWINSSNVKLIRETINCLNFF